MIVMFFGANGFSSDSPEITLRRQVVTAMRKAATFYQNSVASHGGYVYYYSVDLKQQWGEGVATRDQIWVQPPGTPTVGMAYLKAYEATGDSFYLNAAQEAAEALVYGQLKSGGWTNVIDFNRRGRVAQYRNGKGGGKNNSSFDDGQSQSAIRLLIHVDKALDFKHQAIGEAAGFALDALHGAQFPNGAFPQVWTGPVKQQPILKASYPDYDWRKEGRVKNYWDMYTLNDNVCGYITETLIDACRIYNDERFMTALKRLGDFMILAQMPNPQQGWAQQYNYEMKPIWARKFEPPAISGDESQEVIETLMEIYRITNDRKYLEPIPRALAYLKRSLLADGRLSRYYELRTNRPLYMFRRGEVYTLTYDDSKLPKHYGWKIDSRLGKIAEQYKKLKRNIGTAAEPKSLVNLEQQVRNVTKKLDGQGRWISIYRGEQLVGQPKFKLNSSYISSAVFSQNVELLSEYMIATKNR
jgi:PelA/Pel-15E family pectate lyase